MESQRVRHDWETELNWFWEKQEILCLGEHIFWKSTLEGLTESMSPLTHRDTLPWRGTNLMHLRCPFSILLLPRSPEWKAKEDPMSHYYRLSSVPQAPACSIMYQTILSLLKRLQSNTAEFVSKDRVSSVHFLISILATYPCNVSTFPLTWTTILITPSLFLTWRMLMLSDGSLSTFIINPSHTSLLNYFS